MKKQKKIEPEDIPFEEEKLFEEVVEPKPIKKEWAKAEKYKEVNNG